jgi:hypothetical protein
MAQGNRTPASPLRPLARLVQNTLTVADVATRPLWCIRPAMSAQDALDAMRANDFDVAGVAGTPISYFVSTESLEKAGPRQRVRNLMEPILASDCVEKTLPLAELLVLLIKRKRVFVLDGADVRWIVNRSDLSAPVVSIAVLAHLAAIEEGVKELASDYSQEHLERVMTEEGLAEAKALFKRLSEAGRQISLLDCFWFGDWMDFIRKTDEIRVALGYSSRKTFRDTGFHLSNLRNDTAHTRGILASFDTAERALKRVHEAIELARAVWRLVEARSPIWDRFAESRIVHSRARRAPITGSGAKKRWDWPGETVHVITAWNPAGIWSPHEQNDEANRRLETTLHRHHLTTFPVVGQSENGDWQEDSFLVCGMKRQLAADIAMAFGQTALFEIDSEHVHVIRSDDAQIARTRPRVRP